LLPESRRDLLFANDAHAAKPFAESAGCGFPLQAKGMAQMLRRNYSATDQQQPDGKAVKFGLSCAKPGE